MALEAGGHELLSIKGAHGSVIGMTGNDSIIRFFRMAQEAEREECAKLLESRKTGANELMDAVRDMEANAIRARGNK
jgi:ribonuclease PH